MGNNGASNIDWKAGVKEWHVAESEEDLKNLIYNLKYLSIDENEKLSLSRKAFSEIKRYQNHQICRTRRSQRK